MNWLVDPVDAVAAAEQQVHHSATRDAPDANGYNHPDFDDDDDGNRGNSGGGGASGGGSAGGGSSSKRATGNGGAPRGQFRSSPQPSPLQQKAPPKPPQRLPVPGVGVAQRMSTQAVQDAYNARAILDLPAYGQEQGNYDDNNGNFNGQGHIHGHGMPSPLHSKQPPNPDSIRATVTDNTAELDLSFPTLEFRRCVDKYCALVAFWCSNLCSILSRTWIMLSSCVRFSLLFKHSLLFVLNAHFVPCFPCSSPPITDRRGPSAQPRTTTPTAGGPPSKSPKAKAPCGPPWCTSDAPSTLSLPTTIFQALLLPPITACPLHNTNTNNININSNSTNININSNSTSSSSSSCRLSGSTLCTPHLGATTAAT